MNCVICKLGGTHHGHTTDVLQRDITIVVIRDVPADTCDNCDEYYLSEAVTRRVLELGEPAWALGAEFAALRFAA
ncbi:MAG TPA: type II toxin-antitoxin system MqsA family antitoxin [Ktedonobacterales bacterium]